MKPQSIGLALLVVSGFALVPVACSSDSREPARREKSAVASTQVDLVNVNEVLAPATSIQLAVINFALFQPLLEEQADYQKGPPTFKPALAESWAFSEDRKTLTFKLRPNLVWSDGAPITAEDVKFTFEAQTAPEIAWVAAGDKERITQVEVVDPLTVKMTFKEVYPTQLLDANQGVILPKHAWGKIPFKDWRANSDYFRDHLVVSGPFTLEKWEPQQRFVLRRNEKYFAPGLPKLDRITFEIIPEISAQLAQLRAGKVDFVEFVPYENLSQLEKDPAIKLWPTIPRYFFGILWNTKQTFLEEKGVRQALTLAIDRQSIVDSLFGGYANVSVSPYPSDVWAHHQGLEPWPYDPEKARQQLAALGFQDRDGDGILDRDGKKLSVELLTNSENALRKNIMLIAQEQLKKIGVDATAKALEFNAMLEPLTTQKFGGAVVGLAISTDLNLRHNFHTSGLGSFNWGAYSNPELDRLIEEAERTMDPAQAKKLYDQIQETLHDEQPVTFTYEAQRLCATTSRLLNVDPNSVSPHAHLRDWDLADGN